MARDFILVLDFGGVQALSIARKFRSQGIYCEVYSSDIDIDTILKKSPRGLLLAGGSNHTSFDPGLFRLNIPVLSMGRAALCMAECVGILCGGTMRKEQTAQITFLPCTLFDGLNESDRFFDSIDALKLPGGYSAIALTDDGLIPAFANHEAHLYGLQFYPESNDPEGAQILVNFAQTICGCTPFWSPQFYIEQEIQHLMDRIGNRHAIMAVSGGVDSTVCALLAQQAIGERLRCVFVNTGLLRKGEAESVMETFHNLRITPNVIDIRDFIFTALKGVTDPQQKRQIILEEIRATIHREAESLSNVDFVIEGTIYSDLLQNNVDTLNTDTRLGKYERLEPFRMLFKEEVRAIGEILGCPKEFLYQQPFPSCGLASRCSGEVTPERLAMLRNANAIFQEEILAAHLDKKLDRYYAVLTNIQGKGLRDGFVTYEYCCVLRAFTYAAPNIFFAKLPYDLLERTMQRIITDVPGINHVVYDITSRPYGDVEWE